MRSVVRRMASVLFFPLFVWSKLYNNLIQGKVITIILHDLSAHDIIRLKKVILFLSKHFRFISPAEFEKMHATGKIPKGISFLVTFDDGFLSSKHAAEQVLDPLGIKAAFFCCGSFIGMHETEAKIFVADRIYQKSRQACEILPQEQPMSELDIQTLVSRGHTIGCHTDSHPILSSIKNRDELTDDFNLSKNKLKSIVGQDVTWFAYPFGRIDCVDEFSINIIKENYKYCFSGIGGNTEPRGAYSLARICLTLQDPYFLQLALLLGAANPYYWKQRKALRSLSENKQKYCLHGQCT